MDISVVTTLYKSQPFIEEFYSRIVATIQSITSSYEIIFVNDGSPDESLKQVIKISEMDPKVSVVDLSRNFGHHKAIMTGLQYCRGKNVFLIDIDLEEPPECLSEFYSLLHKQECDVVYGYQSARKGNLFEKISGYAFYWLFNRLSNYPIPASITTARLMTDRYVTSLLEHKERELFLGGLFAITGYKQLGIKIEKGLSGNSTYTLSKKIALFVNSITSFSDKPLVYIFYLGFVIMSVTILLGTAILFFRLLNTQFQLGWLSLVLSVWFLGGLIIFCIGVIGMYLSKIFIETKQRPFTLVKRVYGNARVCN